MEMNNKKVYNSEHPFPMELMFNRNVSTEWKDSKNNLHLEMINAPAGEFRKVCITKVKSTWNKEPFDPCELTPSEEKREFLKILRRKVLPNSLESLQFDFRVDGLTLIEVTHLLRHRMLKGIHAQCSADRFLTEDSCFIPSSIQKSRFSEEYIRLTNECKKLYNNMVSSGDISILDARYILTRNHRYFYYFTIDLKTAIEFINQRKCTQIQPELDNIFAHQMHSKICSVIPEFKDAVPMMCGANCVYVNSESSDSSRVFYPDKNHKKLIKKKYGKDSERLKKNYYLHQKTRREMGTEYNFQEGNGKIK